jgi:hypothetical protein
MVLKEQQTLEEKAMAQAATNPVLQVENTKEVNIDQHVLKRLKKFFCTSFFHANIFCQFLTF